MVDTRTDMSRDSGSLGSDHAPSLETAYLHPYIRGKLSLPHSGFHRIAAILFLFHKPHGGGAAGADT